MVCIRSSRGLTNLSAKNEFHIRKNADGHRCFAASAKIGRALGKALSQPQPFRGQSLVEQSTASRVRNDKIIAVFAYHLSLIIHLHEERLHYRRERPAAIGHFAHDADAGCWRYPAVNGQLARRG